MENSWKKYLTATVAAAALGIGVFALRGGFSTIDTKTLYSCLSDAFFVPGILLIAFSLLMFVSGEGIFNIFGFAAIKVIFPFMKKNRERRDMTYYEYCQSKSEGRKKVSFWYLCLIGAALLALGGLFALLCETTPEILSPAV